MNDSGYLFRWNLGTEVNVIGTLKKYILLAFMYYKCVCTFVSNSKNYPDFLIIPICREFLLIIFSSGITNI